MDKTTQVVRNGSFRGKSSYKSLHYSKLEYKIMHEIRSLCALMENFSATKPFELGCLILRLTEKPKITAIKKLRQFFSLNFESRMLAAKSKMFVTITPLCFETQV